MVKTDCIHNMPFHSQFISPRVPIWLCQLVKEHYDCENCPDYELEKGREAQSENTNESASTT